MKLKFGSIKIFYIILFLGTISCNKRSVKLPVLNISGIQDTIYDNTQIWMFYTFQNGDTIAELNRNNAIATTNWIFNIDRRLPLHQVIPNLKKLIEKREKPAMHPKDADDTNYFSYVDVRSNTLSTVQFDIINYITDEKPTKFDFKKDSLTKHIVINHFKYGFTVNDSVISIDHLNTFLNNQLDSFQLKLHLNFDKYLSYQEYLHLKAILQNIKNDSILVDKNEYVILD